MNISELFEMQKKLDQTIEKEKGIKEDATDYMITALFSEIGEALNEWRWFKIWSNDRKPRPGLLEELVDCLHFILSIGWRCGLEKYFVIPDQLPEKLDRSAMHYFIKLCNKLGDFYDLRTKWNYQRITEYYVMLVYALGFTWEQIEQAYMEKNRVNYERQANGY